MATAKNAKTADFTKTVKEAAADAQTRLKSVYDKGAEVGADVVEFHKGNIEALVESGKILVVELEIQAKGHNSVHGAE